MSIPVMRKQPCRGQSGGGRPDRSPSPVHPHPIRDRTELGAAKVGGIGRKEHLNTFPL